MKSGPAPVSTQADSWKVYAPKGGYYKVSLPADWPTIDAQSHGVRQHRHCFWRGEP